MPATIPAQRFPLEGRIKPSANGSHPVDDENNDGMAALNPPNLNEQGKPTQRAITTAKQAWSIAKRHRDRAIQGRIRRAAIIASAYNGDAPFDQNELVATGQGWRNNFSTNFLASLIDRVTPQLTDPANKADLLTHSQLPNGYQDGATKSRKFQERTTKLIRSWKKWKDLLSGLAKEIVLYGNACPMRIDSNWRPRLWGFGECFLPEGTGQHARDVQIAIAFQPMLLHEFIDLFKDSAVAKKANYNLPGCIQIANRTHGTESGPNNDPTPLDRADVAREGGGMMGWSYDNPNRTVNMLHILVRDYSGEVDLWTVDADEGIEVRNEEGLHEQIEDGITLFTFQSGNRKYYGSKGLGRLETNLHKAIERGRNLGADQMYLSGLIIFEGDPKDATSIQSKVRHPFVIVKSAGRLIQQQIAFNFEAFAAMDNKLVAIAEQIAGAFIPPNLDNEGSSNTKIEAAQKAERELAVKEGVLGRFFDHLSEMIGMMQRGIYNADNIREGVRIYRLKKESMVKRGVRMIWRKVAKVLKKAGVKMEMTEPTPEVIAADEDAVEAIVDLLEEGLSPEEIITLSLQPAGANNSDEGADKDNRTIGMLQANQQAPDPNIDQHAATEMLWRLTVGEDRAKQLIVPQDDPSVTARARNLQLMEIGEMVDGNPMDVPRDDNHVAHREILGPRLGDLIHALQIAPTVPLVKTAGLMLDHYQKHLGFDRVTPEEAKKQEAGVMKQWEAVINKAGVALDKRAAELQAAGGKMGPDGNPVPVQGQPLTASGPGGTIPGDNPQAITPDHQIKAAEVAGKIHAQETEAQLRARELDLLEKKHDHQVTKDALTLQQDNVRIVQDQAHHTNEQGQQEADRELERMVQENAGSSPGALE